MQVGSSFIRLVAQNILVQLVLEKEVI